MSFLNRKGQYIAEYALLIAIVAATCTAMYTYIRKSMNYRTQLVENEMSVSRRDLLAGQPTGQSLPGSRLQGTAPQKK